MDSIIKPLVTEADEDQTDLMLDPAEYLFKHTKYHDIQIKVEDPASDSAEVIGVVSSHLVAHSSEFRKLLAVKQTQPIPIKNVSPSVFKLMLTYMYGGGLPDMERSTAAQLALSANYYNIRSLVNHVCLRLVPTTIEDVFPALWCVTYVSCPELEVHVTKLIQEETEELLNSEEFLELDSKCLDFIASQERLEVTELALWQALVKWAQNKVQANPEKTPRQYLQSSLQFVRLTTLSQDEIIKEVMPSKILTPSEVMDLLTSVATNQPWEFPGLCKNQKVRDITSIQQLSDSDQTVVDTKDDTSFQTLYTFTNGIGAYQGYTNNATQAPIDEKISNLTISTKERNVQIQSFTFKSRSIQILGNQPVYKLSCTITVTKIENGFCKETLALQVGGSVLGNEEIVFPLKLRNGLLLTLKAKSKYNFALEFSSPHPIYTVKCGYNSTSVMSTELMSADGFISVKYNTPTHVLQFQYKV